MHGAFIIAMVLICPGLVSAAVTINEIAWMGSVADANREWVELFNNGTAAVSLEGWTLNAQDGAPSISLSGTIAASGYFLLERTSDDSVVGISANQIYTGALGNDGERLILSDATGSVVDSVDGRDGWSIGGDNASKETLQRISGGWGTGAPTPNRANVAAPQSAASTGNTSSAKKSVGGRPVITGSVKKDEPKPERAPLLFGMDIGDDRTVTEGAPVVFEVMGFDEDGDAVSAFAARWNFGDGTVGTGHSTVHTYTHAGRYAVSVTGERTVFRETVSGEGRITITVVAPMLHIAEASASFIEIANAASTDTDLSGFVLTDGVRLFTIPSGTVLLSQASVRFNNATTGLVPHDADAVSLRYPSGSVVPGTHPVIEPKIETVEENVTANATLRVTVPEELVPVVSAAAPLPDAEPAEIDMPLEASVAMADVMPENGEASPFSGILTLMLIIVAGIVGAVWVQSKFPLTEAGTFAIVEETEDNPKP